jgi:tetratricopeptide (TPR) repeat protein
MPADIFERRESTPTPAPAPAPAPLKRHRDFAVLVAILISTCAPKVMGAELPAGLTPSTTPTARAELSHVVEPPEMKDMPTPTPIKPSAVDVAFINSKLLQKVDPDHPVTLQPALRELQGLIQQDPARSDFYLLRANLSCFAHGDLAALLADLEKSIGLYDARHSAYKNLAGHYALRAKINFDAGDATGAMADLDRAMKEDYDDASDIFNDGKVEPTKVPKPCIWTLADLDALGERFPSDSRPALYRGIYLTFFTHYHTDSDFRPILSAFEQAGKLDPKSALPHFYLGRSYVIGGLGGMFSMTSAKCLDYVVPRTQDCLAMDQAHETGVQELTAAIALDPAFAPAYGLRAEGLSKLKRYRQSLRDYKKATTLEHDVHEKHILLNDAALVEVQLGLYSQAVIDLSAAIDLGCNESCGSYENRADAFAKLKEYKKAVEDMSLAIRQKLQITLLTGIGQFRRMYPEYDAISDDVICDLIRRRVFPQMSYADFSHKFLIESKGFDEFVLADLYVKRGDYYGKLGEHGVASRDYKRAIAVFPPYATQKFKGMHGNLVRLPD